MTIYLDSPEIDVLSKETSVRGSIVRLALQKAASVDPTERVLLEEALRELLCRFEGEERIQA